MHRPYRAAGLMTLALTLAVCALVLVGSTPEALAFSAHPFAPTAGFLDHFAMAGPLALSALRSREADLATRAAAKEREIVDGMSAEARAAVVADHEGLLSEIEATRTEIRALEAAPVPAPVPAPTAPSTEAVRAAEAERCASIGELGRRSGLPQDQIDAAVRNTGMTVDAFRAQAFEHMAQVAERNQTRPTGGTAQFGGLDETDTRRRGMADAIAARLARQGGDRNAQVPEHARAYAEMGLVEIAAECVGYRGQIRTARQVGDVFERAFHTVSDFPAIFTDALNVRLLARYRLAQPSYRLFAAPYTATDFRPTHVVRAGDFPTLQPVGEAGEIKSGTFSESKEVFRVNPYAVSVNVSRFMIVNDQLGAIDQMLGSVGERVTDWENGIVFGVLASNPRLLTDNKAVFHADHKNLAAAGSAIAIGSVGAGRSAMMKQTTLDGMKANFTPKTLLCGPDTQTTAEQLFSAITPALAANAIPESFRRMMPHADANLEGNGWYLFADPAIAPCFVYGYLEGFEGPRLTSEQVFNVQGMKVKLEHDFGASAIDYRGAWKDPGQA